MAVQKRGSRTFGAHLYLAERGRRMSPEHLLRSYFHAKDENRPGVLDHVFLEQAVVEIENRSDRISFPAVTTGKDAIAEVLVSQFNRTYEDVRSFYLASPAEDDRRFACDWLVAMSEKATGAVRVGCGRYDWTFRDGAAGLRVGRLVITIEAMLVHPPDFRPVVSRWLAGLDYPWTSAAAVMRALPLPELVEIGRYLGRGEKRA